MGETFNSDAAHYIEARLKTGLWVEAHVRLCFSHNMPTFVVAKGDAERGGVLLKLNQFSDGISLYEQTIDFSGRKMWREAGSFATDAEADAAIVKKRKYDTDLWVLEIEDTDGSYLLDAPISEF